MTKKSVESKRYVLFIYYTISLANILCLHSQMAEAGFYYSGHGEEDDSVTCFACSKVLDGWERTDDPWKEHKKHAPNCPFVKLGRCEHELTVS